MPDPETMTAAVHAYVDAFDVGSADAVAALYAEDAIVEDPVGTPVLHGRAAIHAFYAESMKTGARLTLDGPVRIAGDYAVFPFSVRLQLDGADRRVDVIDSFRFDDAGLVVEMRAYWGPANMHGF